MGIQKENEDLKAKLRVLDRKQLEYRDKLKALEKVQMERDKFEGIIKKLNNKMQPQSQEISELRRQLKEAEAKVESLEAAAAEQETVLEMAALDKEMAEETAEMLKEELDVLKAKLEELELETEVLREENAELSKGMSPEERASTGWLQMERNNERLREALIRLRDMTQEQEEELRAQIRSLEEDLSEHAKIKEQYEQTVQKLHETESAVEQLREQLDNALGAEDMIEDLTERNMTLSEQVEELKAIVEDLEALKEVADELEINHVQNEREMQEELDFKDAVIAEQARRGVQQEEALENMEYTLSRFRELVTSLQSDLEDMRASHAVTETESEQLGARSRAMMDLNMKLQLSAAKAQVKTIDLELRRLEAQEAAQHLGMVKLFLPDSYKEMRDSVLALLRFRRLAFKANLVHGFIRERVNGEAHPGHEDDVLAGCDAMDKLVWVAAMCGRFDRAISRCTPDRFMRYEGALFELEPVERALNGWIDGLRRDELKEKDCAAELSRTIALLTHLAETHMTGSADDDEADGKGNASDDGQQDDLEAFADDVHMRTIMVQAYLESAATALHATRALVQRAVPPAGDEDELAQLFARRAETAIAQTRSAKVMVGKAVRDLEDLRHRSLSLAPPGPALLAPFEKAEAAAKELAALARQTGLDLHALLSDDDVAGGSSGGEDGGKRTYVDVQDAVQRTALAVCSSSESDVFATYLNRLRAVTSQVSELASLCSDLGQTQEFERRPAPWIVRSEELRTAQRSSQSLDAEEKLRRSIEQFQAARQALAQRDEELSTERLKVATLEARTRDAAAKAQRVAELETTLRRSDATVAALKDDIEKQDRELKNLEADRDKWRKLAEDASAAAGAGQSGAAALVQDTAAARAGRERAVATARELDALKAEVAGLRAAVRFLREDNRRARTRDQLALPLSTTSAYSSDISAVTAPGGLDWLSEPLLPRAARLSPAARQAEQRRSLVAAEARDALGALLKLAGNAELFDLSRLNDERAPVVDGSGKQHNIFASWRPAKSSPQWHAARAEEDFAAWRAWRNDVAEKAAVLNLTDGNRNTGGLHRPQQQGPSKVNGVGGAKGAGAGAARIAARLQIRLPALADPKNGNYKSGGADVRIVGSAEWEGLQGRQAVV